MTLDNLRSNPGFVEGWSHCRNALIEFLMRRQLAATAANSTETGPQTLSKLILELEKLDSEPKPLTRPQMRPLHSMKPQKTD